MIPTSALLGVIWFVCGLAMWDRGEQLYGVAGGVVGVVAMVNGLLRG